jgi:hypothetical protein
MELGKPRSLLRHLYCLVFNNSLRNISSQGGDEKVAVNDLNL